MADVGLKIVIGADISKGVAGISKMTAAISGIEPAANNAAAMLNKIPASLRPIDPKKLQDLSSAVQRLRQDITAFPRTPITNPFKELPQGANQATQALTNVGRVAQDLPFGFIGIANNLNPLLESFQRLKAETGSTKGALKALGSSLTGAGGIGLALSLITSALSFVSVGFSAWTRGMGSAKKELEGFDKAIDEANKAAGEEIARVQVLNAVITDNTRTQKERKLAAKELSDILKDVNIKMSQEAILNGQVEEATKKATAAIISRAKARAAEARIAELSGKNLDRDFKRKELTDKQTEAEKKYQDLLAKRGNNRNKDQIEQAGIDQFFASTKITDIKEDIADLDKETSKANKEIAFLLSQIQKNGNKIDKRGGGDEKEVDLLKQRIAALKELQGLTGLDAKQRVELAQLEIQLVKRDAAKLGFTKDEVQQQVTGILEREFPVGTFEFETVVTTRVNKLEPLPVKDAKAITDGFKTNIAKAIGIEGKPLEVPAPPVTLTGLDKSIDQFQETLKNQLGGVVDVLGEAFANIFAGGDLGDSFANAAKGLMGIVGDILQQIGKNMILASTAVEALTKALSGLFGPGGAVAGIAAGALLVATGALIKKVTGPKMPKFADGGIVTGPVIGQIGEMYKPEVIMPLDRLQAMFGRNNDISGGTQLIPIINNEGLYLAMKRGERSAGRKF